MKGEKIRIIIIYFLFLVIVGLVGYLIYFVIDENKTEKPIKEKEPPKQQEEITEACTFDITVAEFNDFDNTPLELCQGNNKINISDIVLKDNAIDIYAIYNKDSKTTSINPGLYMNDNQIIKSISKSDKNIITVSDNLLFIKKDSKKESNLVVFNENGENIYDLAIELVKNKVEDPIFAEIAKTNSEVNPQISIENIDPNSYTFTSGAFTFKTIIKINGEEQNGSTYTVTYNEEKFNTPVVAA